MHRSIMRNAQLQELASATISISKMFRSFRSVSKKELLTFAFEAYMGERTS